MIIASLVSTIIGMLIVIIGMAIECNELSRRNSQLEETMRSMRADQMRRLRELRAEMLLNDADETRPYVVNSFD